MLTLYNSDGVPSYPLNVDADGYYITHMYNGLNTVCFDISPKSAIYKNIAEEIRVSTDDNRYIIKTINERPETATVECILDLDDFKQRFYPLFNVTEHKLSSLLDIILPDGWTHVGSNVSTIKRTTKLELVTDYDVLLSAMDTYGIVFNFDVLNKIVKIIDPSTYTAMGQYLTDELNLRSVSYKGDSTQMATRIYPYGKDGLTIKDVNNGKEYVENKNYCSRIISIGWKDERYTIAENLKAAAELKLKELAYPARSYECDVVDLAKLNPDYDFLSFGMYNVVTLIDRRRNTRINHQIAEYKEYPLAPTNNIVTLSNVVNGIEKKIENLQDELTEQVTDLHQEIQTQTAKITQDFKAADGQLLSKIQAEYPNKETVQSEIAQSANNIMLSVSQGYATKASLELKVGKDDNNQIVSMLNAAADLINIKSNRIAISSTYFTLTNDGALTCTSANLTGTMTAGNNTHNAKLDGGSLKFINDTKHISSFGTTTWAGTSTLGTAVHSEAAAKFVSFGNKSSVGDTQYTTQFALNYGLNPGGIKQDVIIYGSSYFGDAMTVKEANIIFAGYDYSSYLQPATFNGNPAIHASNAFYADGEIYAMGNLGCKGTKNRIVDTDHYGDRKLYAYEMTAPMFGDYGSAQTDDTGTIKICFDSVFLETVESGLEYFVFIQKQCPGDMYVSKKEPDGFTVTGVPNASFDWEVKFRQKGCRTERLEVFNPPAVNDGRQLKSKAAPHTKPFKKAKLKLRRQGNDNNR